MCYRCNLQVLYQSPSCDTLGFHLASAIQDPWYKHGRDGSKRQLTVRRLSNYTRSDVLLLFSIKECFSTDVYAAVRLMSFSESATLQLQPMCGAVQILQGRTPGWDCYVRQLELQGLLHRFKSRPWDLLQRLSTACNWYNFIFIHPESNFVPCSNCRWQLFAIFLCQAVS